MIDTVTAPPRKRLSSALTVFDTWIPTTLMIAVFVILSYAVLARQVLDTPLVFSYELSQLLAVWLVMLGAGLAVRRRSMIAFTVTPPRFEERFGRTLARPRAILAAATAIVLAYEGAVMARATNQTYEALDMSRAVGAWALPAGFVLMAVHYLLIALDPDVHVDVFED